MLFPVRVRAALPVSLAGEDREADCAQAGSVRGEDVTSLDLQPGRVVPRRRNRPLPQRHAARRSGAVTLHFYSLGASAPLRGKGSRSRVGRVYTVRLQDE